MKFKLESKDKDVVLLLVECGDCIELIAKNSRYEQTLLKFGNNIISAPNLFGEIATECLGISEGENIVDYFEKK